MNNGPPWFVHFLLFLKYFNSMKEKERLWLRDFLIPSTSFWVFCYGNCVLQHLPELLALFQPLKACDLFDPYHLISVGPPFDWEEHWDASMSRHLPKTTQMGQSGALIEVYQLHSRPRGFLLSQANFITAPDEVNEWSIKWKLCMFTPRSRMDPDHCNKTV